MITHTHHDRSHIHTIDHTPTHYDRSHTHIMIDHSINRVMIRIMTSHCVRSMTFETSNDKAIKYKNIFLVFGFWCLVWCLGLVFGLVFGLMLVWNNEIERPVQNDKSKKNAMKYISKDARQFLALGL